MKESESEKEQETLFGDQDFVYNTINGHVLDIDDEIKRLLKSKDKIDEKVKKLRKQKDDDLAALNIVGKEIKKLRPEEEEETIEGKPVEDDEKTDPEKEEADEPF